MAINIAINGYGRIGRNILRSIYEYNRQAEFNIVAINDLANLEISSHLTKYDSTHGIFDSEVSHSKNYLLINNDKIKYYSERDPSKLPWKELRVDIVMECTGVFRTRELAQLHIEAGAKRVLLSAPAKDEVDATIVYGVNHELLKPSYTIVSNASCTTNCLAPLAKPLNDSIGIESGQLTAIHAYTNTQNLADNAHKDFRRARSATQSQIPTSTGAATAIGKVIPELNGKLDGLAVRIPTINVSLVDLVFVAKRNTSVEEVNNIMKKAAKNMKGVLGYNNEPLVSCDFNHNPKSSTFDSQLTKVNNGKLVKVFSWYDNEWGFANRMLDTSMAWSKA